MMNVYAVWDEASLSFGALVLCATDGLALRAFSDVCANPESAMAKSPGDYKMYRMGTYDPNTGAIESEKPGPKMMYSASSVVAQLKLAQEGQEAK